MTRSIRTRLLVWVLVLLVPLSIAAAWLLVQVFANRLLHDIDVALEEEAETVAAAVAAPESTATVADLLTRIAAETDLGPRKYIAVVRRGTLMDEAPPGAQKMLESRRPELRIVRYRSNGPQGAVVVSIGASISGALHAKRRLISVLTLGTPLALLLLGTGLWLVIGRNLRPLEEASLQLDKVAAENLSVRVSVENPDDEVGRMVTVLNRMLDRLEDAMAQLRHFTADAAHELRTPLTVLRTGLEVALARDRTAGEYRAALVDALAGTDRMGRLAEDLLTLARLDASDAPRAAAAVDLSEVLQELGDAWSDLGAGQAVEVKTTAAPGLRMNGNAGDLYRLFNNLIDNAVRHSDGGGAVTIRAQRAGEWLQVTVADSGPGIPPDELPRIFDRFYRGQHQPHDRNGTGLGLSIAREIARTHGGQISAANRDGGGCILTVTFPAAPASLDG
jgi:heavy metal sensor kinase